MKSRVETRVTLTLNSAENLPPSMVVEYPLICRAEKVRMQIYKDEAFPYYPPFRGREVEETNTCLAGTRKTRR